MNNELISYQYIVFKQYIINTDETNIVKFYDNKILFLSVLLTNILILVNLLIFTIINILNILIFFIKNIKLIN